ncbi:MAG: helix-turn-helix transcriptional regulator [Vibrio gallaecicus]|uniref:helix-turn-helix domain-containing protein n=1 Tax=Vibrio TaxID=662 RepID=UPI0010C967CC|nr:AraC family transcriptional regulator [Vibrio gallaecicus]MDN3617612.1 AraC family transcriptional regulator [Vibrio gallaecicus]
MPSITISRFTNFIHRRKERYPASKNGLFLVTKGSISFSLAHGVNGSLNSGDFALYTSGEIQDIVINTERGEFSGMCLDFDLSIFQSFLSQYSEIEIPRPSKEYIKFNKSNVNIHQLKELMLTLAELEQPNDFALAKLATALLSLIVEEQPASLAIIANAAQLTVTQKVIRYIEQNIDNDITLDSLADYMGMSPATLKRRLSAENLSFSSLLKVKRISHAATHLRTTNKSITQIAYESGFKSAAHFSTAFKNFHGQTPKDFRVKVENKFNT